MKIAICGSLDFSHKIKEIADELLSSGFEVEIPISVKKILGGRWSLDEIKGEKKNGKFSERAIKNNSIKAYWEVINNSSAILVVNLDKNNIQNYIGGNTFLEMGFTHVLNKKIYLWNDIPDMIYTDELKAMEPIVINGDISKIIKE